MIVFAQISDIHLDGSQRRYERAAAVMSYLDGMPVRLAAVLVTGDIADHGLPGEYEQARALFAASPHPVFPCPGNHDVRATYRTVLLGGDGGDSGGAAGGPDSPVNRVHYTEGALFALCDSTIPGRDDGCLTDESIAWLDHVLTRQPGVPAFVCFHHPPVPLHSPYVDTIRQFGENRLADVVARHPQVVALLCGHAHTPAAAVFAGRPLLTAPGVVSTLVLPWEPGETATEDAPPGLAFHVLDEHRRLVTHYRVVT